MFGVAFTIPGLGWPVYWYGILIALAALSGILMARYRGKRYQWNTDFIIDLCLLVIPLAVVGARVYYVIFDWENVYQGNILNIFKIWEGGLAIYGTIIGGVIGAMIFAKWKKVPLMRILDVVAPGVILGQAIGRWGNYFNQEVYGQIIADPNWQFFPAAVWVYGDWHMALFFYEFVFNMLIFWFLLWFDRKKRRTGTIFLLYIALYGVVRFFLEPLRVDQYILTIGSIPVSQLLSALLVVGSAIWLALLHRKKIVDEYDPGLAILGADKNSLTDDDETAYEDEVDPQEETEVEEEDTVGLPGEEGEAENTGENNSMEDHTDE